MILKSRYLIFLMFFVNFSCTIDPNKSGSIKDATENSIDTEIINEDLVISEIDSEIKLAPDSTVSYLEMKSSIREVKRNLKGKSISKDSLSKIFEGILVNKIIPYWYGTKWSFEGHTAKPKEGEIACGYFVSTTLKDSGIKVNRYKLAQQNPLNEATSLSLDQSIIEINKETISENITELKEKLNEGIYFIGFDQSHVGYALKKKGEIYLIHSNYIDSEGVIIEHIKQSKVFSFYDKFYLAELSTNEELMDRWINDKEIEVMSGDKR